MHDFEDFCGKHTIDFGTVDTLLTEKIAMMLKTGALYSDILAIEGESSATIIHHACHAFSLGKLTREQMASLLELREMQNAFGAIDEIQLINFKKEFFMDAIPLLNNFISPEEQEIFLRELSSKPRVEAKVFCFQVSDSDLAGNKLKEIIDLAAGMQILHKAPNGLIRRHEFSEDTSDEIIDNQSHKIFVLSVGCRDALVKAKYGEHAKRLFPRIGRFSKDDIESSVRSHGRYSAVDYPGIAGSATFHQVKARTFFLTLHDEIHRSLTSSIPNKAYDALLFAVDVIRNNINLPNSPNSSTVWSKDIWDCIDMEVGEFLTFSQDLRNNSSDIRLMTFYFAKLLSAQVYTEGRDGGLFTASPYVDTTWMLLIHMFQHESAWNALSINPSELPVDSGYAEMYKFIVQNIDDIPPNCSLVQQVAMLKSRYFGLAYSVDQDTIFSRDDKNYLQILVDDKPINIVKSDYLSLGQPDNASKLIDLFKLDSREFIIRIERREHFLNLCEVSPEVRQDLFEIILTNDQCFEHIINTTHDFIKISKYSPEHVGDLFNILTNNLGGSSSLVSSTFDIYNLAKTFPEYAEKLIEPLLNDRDFFNRLVTLHYDLIRLIEVFPAHSESFIEIILNDRDIFNRLIIFANNITQLVKIFPKYAEKLIEPLLNDRGFYIRLVKDKYDLIKLVEFFPGHLEELIEPILKDRDIFNRLIKYPSDISKLVESFPQYAEELIEPLLNDRDFYNSLVAFDHDLIRIAKDFPMHADKFIEILMDDKVSFKRVVPNKSSLNRVMESFPTYKEKLDELFNKKNQASLSNHSIFHNIESNQSISEVSEQKPKGPRGS